MAEWLGTVIRRVGLDPPPVKSTPAGANQPSRAGQTDRLDSKHCNRPELSSLKRSRAGCRTPGGVEMLKRIIRALISEQFLKGAERAGSLREVIAIGRRHAYGR